MGYKSSINVGLPNTPDPPNKENLVEFLRIYNAIRGLALTVDSYTGNAVIDQVDYPSYPPSSTLLVQNHNRVYVKASVALTVGKTVNLFSSAGVLSARLANAANPFPMHGWVNTSTPTAAGSYCEVILGGLCSVISGLTIGTTYYQSDTPGTLSASPGTNPQRIGYALDTSKLYVRPDLL